jgi:UDP-GlcNAc:undecaprenyl-phosphate/decaprenyl-phosphate GlcNAc-1-phosphate transferase
MTQSLLGAFILSVLGSLLFTPVAAKLAIHIGAVDQPNERKVHRGVIPRLGGVAIFASALISLAVVVLMNNSQLNSSWITGGKGIAILCGIAGMLFLGIWDDAYDLKPSRKFLGQVVISSVLYYAGVRISAFSIPFSSEALPLGILAYPITVLWITGVTNAFNLTDGLDGLASGIALIAFAAIVPIAILRQDIASVLLGVVYAGAVLGFLRYNFHPAKVFLGDSGSMTLGFVLAVLSIQSSTKGSAVVAIAVPLLALGLPIMETLLSMVRRYLRSFTPEGEVSSSLKSKLKVMFLPDRRHIHHRLLDQGFTHRAAVLALYFIAGILAAGAFLVTVGNDSTSFAILATTAVALFIGIRTLEYKEMSVLHNGILLPLYDRPIMNRESFQIFLDVAFVLLAFAAAALLTNGPQVESLRGFVWPSTVALVLQFSVLWAMGLYRRGYRVIGINDILEIVKGVAMSLLVTALIFGMFSAYIGTVSIAAHALNFFILLSFILGSRCSHIVLQHLYRQEMKSGSQVLIYGANSEGLWMLERILQLNFVGIIPVGFLDDDPKLEGRTLNGYPIYGGHWALASISKDVRISEIVLCSDHIKPEALRRLQKFAKENKISLTRSRVIFEEVHEDLAGDQKHEASVFRIRTQPVHSIKKERIHAVKAAQPEISSSTK